MLRVPVVEAAREAVSLPAADGAVATAIGLLPTGQVQAGWALACAGAEARCLRHISASAASPS